MFYQRLDFKNGQKLPNFFLKKSFFYLKSKKYIFIICKMKLSNQLIMLTFIEGTTFFMEVEWYD